MEKCLRVFLDVFSFSLSQERPPVPVRPQDLFSMYIACAPSPPSHQDREKDQGEEKIKGTSPCPSETPEFILYVACMLSPLPPRQRKRPRRRKNQRSIPLPQWDPRTPSQPSCSPTRTYLLHMLQLCVVYEWTGTYAQCNFSCSLGLYCFTCYMFIVCVHKLEYWLAISSRQSIKITVFCALSNDLVWYESSLLTAK